MIDAEARHTFTHFHLRLRVLVADVGQDAEPETGTFNPIHFGHLRSAMELLDELPLAQLRFVPAAVPPHRELPQVAARHRAAMVEAAIAGETRLICDRRELARSGPSYTYDTLLELREELGPEQPLALLMGCDALLRLPQWHRWEELLSQTHLVVMARPGWEFPSAGPVAELLLAYEVDSAAQPSVLLQKPSGSVLSITLRPQHISSTAIRALLQSGKSARYLIPDAVLEYITEHHLYESSALAGS
jgi:nicotinate-nucleotide adenylyltransferase